MRVLMLGWEFPPHVSGGLGTACHGMTKALSREGAEILFLLPHAFRDVRARHLRMLAADPAADVSLVSFVSMLPVDSALLPYLDAREYAERVRRLASRGRTAGAPPAPRTGTDRFDPSEGRAVVAHRGSASYGPDLMAEVARYAAAAEGVARAHAFDVVHAHDWMTWPAGAAASRVSGRPLVAHVHACEHDRCPAGPDPRIVAIEREGLEAADAVVCVSRYTAGVVRRRYGVPKSKIRVVHNGVEPAPRRRPRHAERPPGAPGRAPVVLFLGRVTAQKGPARFLDAAAIVKRRLPSARFVVAGSGDLLASMVERAARLGLSRHVRFTGFLGPRDVERAYAMADVYVMPSRSEPFGIAPLEALLRGVPVVLSTRSGVREVLASAPAAHPDDAREIADRILEILLRPALSRRLVREGRSEARRARWGRGAKRLLRVYADVVRAGSRP